MVKIKKKNINYYIKRLIIVEHQKRGKKFVHDWIELLTNRKKVMMFDYEKNEITLIL
jgi:hypothetical protein